MINDPITPNSYYVRPSGSRIIINEVYIDEHSNTLVQYFDQRNGRRVVEASKMYRLIENGELERIYP